MNSEVASKLTAQCNICRAHFASRNRLFDHIRDDHADETKTASGDDGADDPADDNVQRRTNASLKARSQLANADHDAYYQQQLLHGDIFTQDEWDIAKQFYRLPLKVAFRLQRQHHSTRDHPSSALRIMDLLEQHAPQEDAFVPSDVVGIHHAWVCAKPLRHLSKAAQKILADAQDLGVIQRQELCSMVPPLLLDLPSACSGQKEIEDGKDRPVTILDLCSAPGSKSLQILDKLHELAASSNQASNNLDMDATTIISQPPTALLVANDSNRNRLLILQRRSRHQPRSSLVLNCSDGRYFPSLRKWGGYKLKFSRVLCDVPCSGDGTLRKLSAKAWSQWSVKSHLQLHKLQLRLLMRALEIVEKGGKVVYSTCSLDPIENEAVVTTAIARLGGPTVYRILPAPQRLQSDCQANFRYCRGTETWRVPHPKFTARSCIMYNQLHEVPKQLRKKDILPSMFPPCTRTRESWELLDKERSNNLPNPHQEHQQREGNDEPPVLEETERDRMIKAMSHGDILSETDIALYENMLPNCCRILPQHMDSGGFFCAIIERVAPTYFAVCYPQTYQEDSSLDKKPSSIKIAMQELVHGRIVHPVSSAKQMRSYISMILPSEMQSAAEQVFVEGHPTLETAQQWLHQHKAFVDSNSKSSTLPSEWINQASTIVNKHAATPHAATSDGSTAMIAAPPTESKNADSIEAADQDMKRPALYVPMFPKPHPSLAKEFLDFLGLNPTQDHLARDVQRFPIENLVILTGMRQTATARQQYRQPIDVASTICVGSNDKQCNGSSGSHHKMSYFSIGLLSAEARSLYAGGAKFNPTEAGITLCQIPMDAASAAAVDYRGRYAIMDEGIDLLAYCATKRVLGLTRSECAELLRERNLDVRELHQVEMDETFRQNDAWWKRWGFGRNDGSNCIEDWVDGAAIVACEFMQTSTMFFSCTVQQSDCRLILLTDDRSAACAQRLHDLAGSTQ